MASQR